MIYQMFIHYTCTSTSNHHGECPVEMRGGYREGGRRRNEQLVYSTIGAPSESILSSNSMTRETYIVRIQLVIYYLLKFGISAFCIYFIYRFIGVRKLPS